MEHARTILCSNNRIVGVVHKKHIIRTCLMYHAACKVEFQPFKRSYSQLTFFNLFQKLPVHLVRVKNYRCTWYECIVPGMHEILKYSAGKIDLPKPSLYLLSALFACLLRKGSFLMRQQAEVKLAPRQTRPKETTRTYEINLNRKTVNWYICTWLIAWQLLLYVLREQSRSGAPSTYDFSKFFNN